MVRIACRAILFDLDGVLIDSTPAVTRVWTKWATAHGFDPQEVARRAHGQPSIVTIRQYLPHADHELENAQVERAEIEDLKGVVMFPGACKLLAALPPDRWTVVTSCTRRLAEARLGAAGLSIPKHLLTCSDVENGKPHPEPYLRAAALLGFPPAACIVVEDVAVGIRSGKAAGARVIAVRTSATEEELAHSGADWTINNISCMSLIPPSDRPPQDLVFELSVG